MNVLTPEYEEVIHSPRFAVLGSIGKWLFSVALFAITIVGILIIFLNVVLPKLTGMSVYNIVSSSMEPNISAGDLIVTKPVEVNDIKIGEVLTYQLESGEPLTASHRVIGITERDGEPRFLTKGDANENRDEELVQPAQVKGVMAYKIPWLGNIQSWATDANRVNAIHVVAGLLALYAVWMFFRRTDQPPVAPGATESPSADGPPQDLVSAQQQPSSSPGPRSDVESAEGNTSELDRLLNGRPS